MKASTTAFELNVIADACAETDIPDDVAEAERLIAAATAADAQLHGLIKRLCHCAPDRWGLCPTCGRAFQANGNGSGPGYDSSGCNPFKNLLAVARVVRAFYRRARFLIRSSATGVRPPVAASGGTGVPPSGLPASSFSPPDESPQGPGELSALAGRARSSAGRGTNRKGEHRG